MVRYPLNNLNSTFGNQFLFFCHSNLWYLNLSRKNFSAKIINCQLVISAIFIKWNSTKINWKISFILSIIHSRNGIFHFKNQVPNGVYVFYVYMYFFKKRTIAITIFSYYYTFNMKQWSIKEKKKGIIWTKI